MAACPVFRNRKCLITK